MPNMSQQRYSDYDGQLAGGSGTSTGASTYDSHISTSSYAQHAYRGSVSLQVEDEDDIYYRSTNASRPAPPPGYDDTYYRDEYSRSPWLSNGRLRHHSSSSTGPLLGDEPRSPPLGRARGRLGGFLPSGKEWGFKRTMAYIISLCTLAVFGWLSLTPSGSQRLASLRQSTVGLGTGWKGWTGASAPEVSTGSNSAEDDARWRGWEFARDASLVYTWVNGSNPFQLALRIQYGSEKQAGGARDRDNDDLRFSMRSMAAHLPWHRGTIYIVSPTIPTWLNVSHPRIRWINQDTIVPREFLPVSSSNAVEPYLHRIPGLTERFLVFNDDFMIRRRMEPWDFFDPRGGIRLFLEPGHVNLGKPVPEAKKTKQAWLYSVHHTIQVLYERYGKHWPDPTHAPFVYYRAAFDALHKHFGAHLANNAAHRFRNPDDVLVPFLHHNYVIQEGSRCCGLGYDVVPTPHAQRSFFFVSWTDNRTANAAALAKMGEVDPQVAAFNDNMGKGEEARLAQVQMHEHFVATYKDYPPVFELRES